MGKKTDEAVIQVVRRYHEMWEQLNILRENADASSSEWDEQRAEFETEAFNDLLPGLSRAVGDDAFWRDLTPELAKVARETLADVATPAGSLGTIGKLKKGHAWVNVGNDLADDYGTHKYKISELQVSAETVEYWRRQGYLS